MNSQSVASSINDNRFDPSRGAVRVHPEVLKLAGVSFLFSLIIGCFESNL